MVYLLKMVIFHGYVSHNQMVYFFLRVKPGIHRMFDLDVAYGVLLAMDTCSAKELTVHYEWRDFFFWEADGNSPSVC